MKWNLTIVLISATLVGLLWFTFHDANTPAGSQEPTVYYTKGLIQQFDGTPRGSYELYRIRGFDGQPEIVTSDPGNSYLPPPLIRPKYVATRPHNYPYGSGQAIDFPSLTIGLNADGERQVTNPPDIPNTVYPGDAILSPDDRFFAQSAAVCTEVTLDEPCPTASVLDIYDYQTGNIWHFNPDQGGAFRRDVATPFPSR